MSHKNKYFIILVAIIVIGCANVEFKKPLISIDQQMPTGIQDGEAIVVLSETKSFLGYHEWKLGKCISNAFKRLNRKIEVYSSGGEFHGFFSLILICWMLMIIQLGERSIAFLRIKKF
jgi:hypothetical protein